uniref:Carboxypeptidase n=1 Tax=Oryza punctata TaxID=4537 RepID=A0A0E0L8R8_ORYPU
MTTTTTSAIGSLVLLLVVVVAVGGVCAEGGGGGEAEAEAWRAEQERDRVARVPGQDFDVGFAQYAGATILRSESILLTTAFNLPGPGCSSIAYGVAEEVGPFHVNADGQGVHLNPYSWNQVANILFLDSPVGVGYSYSNVSDDILNNGDARTANDSLMFLTKWIERFPQYKGREFYVTGESYAGHYVPQLAQAIKRHHEVTGDKSINLKGYMVGNALFDDFHDHLGIFQFMWTNGLISDQTYRLLNVFCDYESFVHTSSQCNKILDIASDEAGNIDSYSIFTPTCHASFASSRNKVMKRLHSVGKMGERYDPCTEKHSTVYFNLAEVQKALHVSPIINKSKWETCSDVVNTNWKDCERSVLHIYHELIQYGLRIWVFSGDTDAVLPVTSTRYSIDALKLPTVTPWNAWYDDDGEVGGWTQGYKGLNFVTVRGAGHEVPLHRPKQALILIKSFLAGSPMPSAQDFYSDIVKWARGVFFGMTL